MQGGVSLLCCGGSELGRCTWTRSQFPGSPWASMNWTLKSRTRWSDVNQCSPYCNTAPLLIQTAVLGQLIISGTLWYISSKLKCGWQKWLIPSNYMKIPGWVWFKTISFRRHGDGYNLPSKDEDDRLGVVVGEEGGGLKGGGGEAHRELKLILLLIVCCIVWNFKTTPFPHHHMFWSNIRYMLK